MYYSPKFNYIVFLTQNEVIYVIKNLEDKVENNDENIIEVSLDD